uniref:Uncharacterized protein n=1 Tax=Romanomermis culicivorax TaxID=13658 RepID=A0A915IEQ0_ROMCU
MAVGWIGVDSSISTWAKVEISSSVSFKKSVICVTVRVRSAVAAGRGRADTSVDGSSFTLFKSKISVSRSSLSAGSTSITEVGQSNSSSMAYSAAEQVEAKSAANGMQVVKHRNQLPSTCKRLRMVEGR